MGADVCIVAAHSLPSLPLVVRAIWVIMCLVLIGAEALLASGLAQSALLRDVALWGKNKEWTAGDKNTPWLVRCLNVPKHWFLHFYLVGMVWHAFLLAGCLYISAHQLSGAAVLEPILCACEPATHWTISKETCVLALALMLLQTSRRAWECVFVSRPSGAQMHLAHYLVGLGFYVGTGLAIVAESPFVAATDATPASAVPASAMWQWAGVALFVWGTIHQYRCHVILADLRGGGNTKAYGYAIPRGDWFEYVSSPHYLAELVVYAGIAVAMATRNLAWWAVLAFAITNLTWGAVKTHQWYLKKFEDYPQQRKAIFPGIL